MADETTAPPQDQPLDMLYPNIFKNERSHTFAVSTDYGYLYSITIAVLPAPAPAPAAVTLDSPTPLQPGYLNVDAAGNAASGFAGTCAGEGSAKRVFVFTPPEDGTVDIAVQSGSLLALYARTDATSELECATASAVTTLQLSVKAGVAVHVFVDGGVPGAEMPAFKLTTVFFPSSP